MYLKLSQENNTSIVFPYKSCLFSTISEKHRMDIIICEEKNWDKILRRYENGEEEMGRCTSPSCEVVKILYVEQEGMRQIKKCKAMWI